MNNENFKEKAYYFRDSSEDEVKEEQLKLFFEELVHRKKTIGRSGLQAAFVLFPTVFGAKVCERDGDAPYDHSVINLVKFLNDQKDFLSIDESFVYELRKDAMEEADSKAVRGRIVSKENSFLLVITGGRYSPLNKFQREVLKEALTFCEESRNKGVFSEVKVGVTLYGEGVEIECDTLTDNQLEKLKVALGIGKK